MGVAAPGETIGAVGGGSVLKRIIMVCTYLLQDNYDDIMLLYRAVKQALFCLPTRTNVGPTTVLGR